MILERGQDRSPRVSEAPQGDPFGRRTEPTPPRLELLRPTGQTTEAGHGHGQECDADDVECIRAQKGRAPELLEERSEGERFVRLGERIATRRPRVPPEVVLRRATPAARTDTSGRSRSSGIPTGIYSEGSRRTRSRQSSAGSRRHLRRCWSPGCTTSRFARADPPRPTRSARAPASRASSKTACSAHARESCPPMPPGPRSPRRQAGGTL